MIAIFFPFHFKIVAATSVQNGAKRAPFFVERVAHLMDVEHDLAFESVQRNEHSALANVRAFSHEPKSRTMLAENEEFVVFGGETQAFGNRAGFHRFVFAEFHCVFARLLYPARGAFVFIVIEDNCVFVSRAV